MASRNKQPLGRVATLGRLEVFMPQSQFVRALARNDLQAPTDLHAKGFNVERILLEVFGAQEVISIDNSDYEGANWIWDMNREIPDDWCEQFDTILDFGTLEHILDCQTALANVYRMCRPGGMILHCNPMNGWVGHGFYQFSPVFFSSFYERVPTKEFHQRVVEFDLSPFTAGIGKGRSFSLAKLEGNLRHEVMGPNRSELQTLVRLKEKVAVPKDWSQPDYDHLWAQSGAHEIAGGLAPITLSAPSGIRKRLNSILSVSLEKLPVLRSLFYGSGAVRLKVALANHRRGLSKSNRSFVRSRAS